MGNAIVANVNLDYELYHQQEAIEAGKTLAGKVIVEVHENLDPTNLTLEVNGKEKTTAHVGDKKLQDKHCFFRSDIQLYQAKEKIQPNTYVFPFSVLLPNSLPASRFHEDEDGSLSILYSLKLKTDLAQISPYKRTFEVVSAYSAAQSVPCLLQPKPIIPEDLGLDAEGYLFLGAHVKDTVIQKGQDLQCSLACRNESTLRIDAAVVTLEQQYYYTTKSFGGHGKSDIKEKGGLKRLPGIRVVGLHSSEIEGRVVDEETLARRMFKDLKSKGNITSLTIPTTALESYSGLIIQVSHFLRFSVMPRGEDEIWPSIRIPIYIGSETLQGNNNLGLEKFSDHVSEKARVRFPLAKALPECTVFGGDAGVLEDDDSLSRPIPSPVNVDPSLETVLEEMTASINDYDYLVDKMKDLDWAIFFASLTPEEYGNIIALVGSDFAQPRVAALLARNYGGDFTCSHCAAAIRNVAAVFRSNVVEGLLAYCSDLSSNNDLIRNELTDFEQIIVALHALNEDEDEEMEERRRERSTSSQKRDSAGEVGVPTDIFVSMEPEEVEKPPSEMTLDVALKDSQSVTKDSSKAIPPIPKPPNQGQKQPVGRATPQPSDILLGVKEHGATQKFLNAIKDVVEKGDFSEYCPPVYRIVKRQLGQQQRYLIRPSMMNPNYWREATKIELIEYMGTIFDKFKEEKDQKNGQPDSWQDSGLRLGGDMGPRPNGKRWQQALKSSSSSWDLAVTVHTYTSEIEGGSSIPGQPQGPSVTDICFFKPKHPGNAVLIRSVRAALQNNPEAVWSPPLYRAIKKPLVNRRFFVKVGERAWREATQMERRENIERYFGFEKKRALQKRDKLRTSNHASTENASRRKASPPGDGEGSSSRRNKSRSSSFAEKVSPIQVRRRFQSETFEPRIVSPVKAFRRASSKEIPESPKQTRRSLFSRDDGKDTRSTSSKEGSNSGHRVTRRSFGAPGERRVKRSNSAGKYNARESITGETNGSTERRQNLRRSNSMGKYSPHKNRNAGLGSPNGKTVKRRNKSSDNIFSSRQEQQKFASRRKSAENIDAPPFESSMEFNGNASGGNLDAKNGESSTGRSGPFRRLVRNDSVRSIQKRNMRHPRDMDICHGSNTHPGTVAWMEAVLKAIHRSGGKPWSAALHKGIQKELQGRRFFVRPEGKSRWREATTEERASLTRAFFESKRRERRG